MAGGGDDLSTVEIICEARRKTRIFYLYSIALYMNLCMISVFLYSCVGGVMSNAIKLFEGNQIRSVWDNEQEEWFFSVVDVVAVLTESDKPRDYWYRVKKRMSDEEKSELSTICRQLKLKAPDGKMRETDVADMQGIFRIIQSIPSPKAEPFKLWLAQIGKERIDEIIDPELTIDRALETYLKKGYTREWINQRLQAIQVRKELTDTWLDHGVKEGREFAILTNEISKAWSGMTTREYKDFKGLKKENLATICPPLN